MLPDQIDVLRQRNKRLLEQLRHRREKLERMSGGGGGCSSSRKRGREDEDEEKEPGERRQPEVIVTLTEEDGGPARSALAKPSVRFNDTQQLRNSSRHFGTCKHGVPAEATTTPDCNRDSQGCDSPSEPAPVPLQSVQVSPSKVQKEIRSRVRFQCDEPESEPPSDRHHVQPLLGYDWIAGVLDSEDSLVERPEEFFNDLRMFRSINRDECIHPGPAESFGENNLFPPLLTDEDNTEENTDTHLCTFSYRINSRLFPVPLHSQDCCPVCKRHKSSHPHTAAEPALIRVSVPRTNLLPPYKYKAHRRSSFDPSDSLGLPSHCLSGWSNAGQNILPPSSSLDLRSNIRTENSDGSLNQDLQELSSPRRNQNLEQIADVRRLARYNFQHFSAKRKPTGPSFAVG